MSYSESISNVEYNHATLPIDVRCRDLYVDRNYFGPFGSQGFSVQLAGDYEILSATTLIPFNLVNTSFGGYNTGNLFSTVDHSGTIQVSGIYNVTCMVDYIHNGFPGSESVLATIKRNGLLGESLASNTIWYTNGSNDIETIVCCNNVSLTAGDTLECYLSCPFAGDFNQLIGSFSRFSCQRIA